MIFLILGAMLIAATTVVVWPLVRHQKSVSIHAIATIVLMVALSAGLYRMIGAPNEESAGSQQLATVEDVVARLAQRLRNNPDDLEGWKMLGRSYFQLRNYGKAIQAFEQATRLESGSNGQTLVDLGEAVLMQDQSAMTGRAGQLFENALAAAPNNQKALFYGGLAAVERGEKFLAADRWEKLLAMSPPEGVQEILRQRIADLRGQETPVQETSAGPIVSAAIALAPAAESAMSPDATVFIIARDPAQPSPPIAAVRKRVIDLPATVALSDSDAMVPGRLLSGFSEIEIVARVSMSGQPIAQPGDWFGEDIVRPSESSKISIVIDREVK